MPCSAEQVGNVVVHERWDGPYHMVVTGYPGWPWEWLLEEDGEIIAEGDEPSQQAAMMAVEEMAQEAARIAAGDWGDHPAALPSH